MAFSDVVGKTVPKGKRGQLLAVRASVGGGLTLIAGLALRLGVGGDAGMWLYAGLLLAAAALWALAAVLFGAIPEQAGATAGGRNALAEVRAGFGVLISQAGFRRYLLARVLLLPVELAVPFYALHSRRLGLGAGDLGIAIIAVGIANLVSSPVWGRTADRVSSRLVMVLAGGVSALASGAALALGRIFGDNLTALAYAPVFLLAGLAIAGVRLGRKTYLVDATNERDRSLYVSLANTLIGALTFAWGLLGLLADAAGMTVLLATLLGLAVAAAAAALWSPEASAMRQE